MKNKNLRKKRVRMQNFLFMFLLFLFSTTSLWAQVAIKGSIVDENNEPMTGVTIKVKDTQVGTISNIDGEFNISAPNANSTLVFSFLGFKQKEVNLNGQTSIKVSMEEDVKSLEEVVVVGYGTQKKVNLTGSLSNVSGEELNKRNASNASILLQGTMPGVSVTTTSGRPGYDGAGIKIRGTGSINSGTAPLVLVDGVEGHMNFLDPNSIESITVLKDAASASIYGSRASNGVILVTTKTGTEGDKVKVSYNGYVGYNTPTNMPKPLNAVAYMEASNVASKNNNENPAFTDEYINLYKTQGADNITRYDTDWVDLVMKDKALVHNHSLSINGGSKSVRFFGNAAYFFNDGQIANNKYERNTLRLNVDFTIARWLKAGVNTNLRLSSSTTPGDVYSNAPESIIQKATTYVPIYGAINNDGTWANGQNGDNPLAASKDTGQSKGSATEIGLKGWVTANPFKGMDITASYSTNRLDDESKRFLQPYDTYLDGVYQTSFPAGDNERYNSWGRVVLNQFNVQASYEKDIKGHNFKILGGMQTDERVAKSFDTKVSNFKYPGFDEMGLGEYSQAYSTSGSSEWAMLSYYARVNYNYKERYLLEMNGRWDASTRFHQDHRWGFFPSFSAGWRISEEAFFEPLRDKIDNLKLRASYGTLGNQDIGSNYFSYTSLISGAQGYWFDAIQGTGMAQTALHNELISWEKSSQLNLGLDANFFNSRLSFTFDIYKRKVYDMLQRFPIPSFVGGYTAPFENAGDMQNKGWELSLGWQDKVQDFSYNVSFHLSDVKNKVTDLYGQEYKDNNAGTITREGLALYSYYGLESDGYFQTQEEIDNSAGSYNMAKDKLRPGYIRYKDQLTVDTDGDGIPDAGDGVINDEDRVVLGSNMPRYEFGVNLGANWKGFDLSLFFQGIGKRDLMYSGYGVIPLHIGRNMFEHQLDYWTEDNRDAEFPILLRDQGNNTNPNTVKSDFWMKSGSFLRLKNLTFGYTLPNKVSRQIGLSNLRVYTNIQNVFTISSAYKGYDPEVAVNGGSFYPLMQTFTFGVNIDF